MPEPSHRSRAMSRRQRHPALRTALMVLGVLLIILSAFVGPLPGPGGIFVFAGGLVLVLQNSYWARVRFARAKRRWPKVGHFADRVLRRQSARRRRERAALVAAEQAPPR